MCKGMTPTPTPRHPIGGAFSLRLPRGPPCVRTLPASFALAALLALSVTGCAVSRDQIHRRPVCGRHRHHRAGEGAVCRDATVSAVAIRVETLRGVVQLSGFARSAAERVRAEAFGAGHAGGGWGAQ